MDSEWIVGRKEIMAALHKDSWSSVRRWRDRFGIEFLTWPNGQPAISRKAMNQFLIRFSKKVAPTRHPTAPTLSPFIREKIGS